ncbi:MAG: hypothetical protein NTU69_11975 [Proteobacteria bacterium]|nr:hypothetical protein [Pseudomonadota bacterium]
MNPDDSPYYSIEFIEEDGKLYVLFYNADREMVAKKEIPQGITIETYLEKMQNN